MAAGPVIALIDGDHHPSTVRDALDRLERERGVVGVVFCGGEEKLRPGTLERPELHYGRRIEIDAPEEGIRRLARRAECVVDLADDPVLPAPAKLRLAALALHLRLRYEAAGTRLAPPRYEPVPFDGPKLAVIGTGKRTGKTALAGHLASLLRGRGVEPIVVCMGRGGPAQPRLARPGTELDELLRLSGDGQHAASDYLEDSALAGVATVGCRRVGGGLAGDPAESNVAKGAALAASLEPGALIFEGSGSCLPPVEVDRTVCTVGDRPGALDALGPYRLLRADLALVLGAGELAGEVRSFCANVLRFTLRAEPADEIDGGARVAVFSTSAAAADGLEPVVSSSNLARRGPLQADLERAAAERCDVYLTELKAAAIDTVAVQARKEGARVVFIRNRPVGLDGDLDAALVKLFAGA